MARYPISLVNAVASRDVFEPARRSRPKINMMPSRFFLLMTIWNVGLPVYRTAARASQAVNIHLLIAWKHAGYDRARGIGAEHA